MTKNEEEILNKFIKNIINSDKAKFVQFPEEKDAYAVLKLNDIIEEINEMVKKLEDERKQ